MKKVILLIGLLITAIALSGCTTQSSLPGTIETPRLGEEGGSQIETPTTQPATAPPVEETSPPELFTGDISTLFPSRGEINTEYEKVYDVRDLNVEKWYYPRYQREGLAITGLQEAKEVGYDILEGSYSPTLTIAEMNILRFDSAQNAKAFYNGLVGMIKEEGGYKEKTASEIDADCFGEEYGSYGEGYGREYICQEKNIVFSTVVGGWEKSRFVDADTLAKIIAKKI